MDKIEKIRQEIERLKKEAAQLTCACASQIAAAAYNKIEAYDNILSFLDTLSEEPDKSLEEAADQKYPVRWKSYPKDGIIRSENGYDVNADRRTAFIAGAKWQAEQDNYDVVFWKGMQHAIEEMKKEAVEGFIFQPEDYYPKELVAQYNGDLKHGDKVKLIIVRSDETSLGLKEQG